ncbi:MAG: LLM class F420-dependent oxidoreductase [SAR202 cluster bacterium Io17-Chloro-G7]|nr:MAG: LLM class F420-dependent oxidoreductase [SAR202 cluster bacterium Io17-Chloro-G7]
MRVLHHLNTSDLNGIPEEARHAESLGYDSLCTEETAHDPFFPLLLAATTTSSVTLETRVAIAFPRSPMVVAYTAMDLQNFSEGRFRLGLGTQVKGHIERRFSTEWGSPGPRLRDYVQSLHAIWETWQDDKKLDYHGDFYNFSLMTPFFNPGSTPSGAPPVFISALNPYNCQVAGEVCQGIALHPITSAKYLTEVIKPNLAKGARIAGRDPEEIILAGSGFVISGTDQETINTRKEAVRRQIAFYFSTRTYFPVLETHGFEEVGQKLHELSLKGEWDRMAGLINDEMLDTFAVIGPHDEVAGRIKERFGGLLDEVVLTTVANSPVDEEAVPKIIEELHS